MTVFFPFFLWNFNLFTFSVLPSVGSKKILAKLTGPLGYLTCKVLAPVVVEHDIYGRKPRSCLGRVFNFKLGSSTDNITYPLNDNGHF
jgi:hypothetical protein